MSRFLCQKTRGTWFTSCYINHKVLPKRHSLYCKRPIKMFKALVSKCKTILTYIRNVLFVVLVCIRPCFGSCLRSRCTGRHSRGRTSSSSSSESRPSIRLFRLWCLPLCLLLRLKREKLMVLVKGGSMLTRLCKFYFSK